MNSKTYVSIVFLVRCRCVERKNNNIMLMIYYALSIYTSVSSQGSVDIESYLLCLVKLVYIVFQ